MNTIDRDVLERKIAYIKNNDEDDLFLIKNEEGIFKPLSTVEAISTMVTTNLPLYNYVVVKENDISHLIKNSSEDSLYYMVGVDKDGCIQFKVMHPISKHNEDYFEASREYIQRGEGIHDVVFIRVAEVDKHEIYNYVDHIDTSSIEEFLCELPKEPFLVHTRDKASNTILSNEYYTKLTAISSYVDILSDYTNNSIALVNGNMPEQSISLGKFPDPNGNELDTVTTTITLLELNKKYTFTGTVSELNEYEKRIREENNYTGTALYTNIVYRDLYDFTDIEFDLDKSSTILDALAGAIEHLDLILSDDVEEYEEDFEDEEYDGLEEE